MDNVAWTGKVTMARADWGDENGSTVTFKLPMVQHEDQRNPFHVYTKRRKGKAGTRFMMACHTDDVNLRHALYEDEVMLAGWNDSQQNGHTVKLWLCNDAMGHPFEGVSRTTKLVISLVELDDDNEPIDQKMRDRVEQQADRGRQKLSNVAAVMCQNPEFWEWLNSNELILGQIRVVNEQAAAQVMRGFLGIDSRAELDSSPVVAKLFHDSIRRPFYESQEVPF